MGLEMSPDYSAPPLPASLKANLWGDVGVLWLAPSKKRNAFDDQTILGIETYFANIGRGIKAAVLTSEGESFSTGLEVSELSKSGPSGGIEHWRLWRRAFDSIQFGKVPVVAVLHGAVVGGGLDLAAATHVRVAEHSVFYALPEESLGNCLNSGAAARLTLLIGAARAMDMMLTGRTYSAEEGQAMGLSTYLVDKGKGLAKGLELAERIAINANFPPTSSPRG